MPSKIRILNRKESVSLRKDLYRYLADIEAVFEDDPDVQHWNNMTHHWTVTLSKYKFDDIVDTTFLEIPDCFEQLLEWSNIYATDTDEKSIIYKHIKFLLEAIVFILPNRLYKFSRFDTFPLFSYFVFLIPLLLAMSDSHRIDEILFWSFFATLLALSVTFVCKVLEEKNHKKHLVKICLITQTLNRSNTLKKILPTTF